MAIFRDIWNLLLGFVTLGAERGNPVALLVLLVAGAVVLFAGRRLFWLVAGVAGYILGSMLAPLIIGPIPVLLNAFSIGLGVVVGLLAAAAQHITARLVTAIAALPIMGFVVAALDPPGWVGLAMLVGGVALALLLLQWFYDAVLILLSALYGAVAVLGAAARVVPDWRWIQNGLFFALLLLAGVAVQAFVLYATQRNPLLIPAAAGGLVRVQQRAQRARPAWLRRAARRVPPEILGLPPAESAANVVDAPTLAAPSLADTPVGAAAGPEFHAQNTATPRPTPGTARD